MQTNSGDNDTSSFIFKRVRRARGLLHSDPFKTIEQRTTHELMEEGKHEQENAIKINNIAVSGRGNGHKGQTFQETSFLPMLLELDT